MQQEFNKHSAEAGPPEAVRDRVEELAYVVGNLIVAREEEYKIDGSTRELLDYIEESISKHGRSVFLLATKADFVDDWKDRLDLYKEALEKAVNIGDADNVYVLASDILDLYQEELRDDDYVAMFNFVNGYAAAHGEETHEEFVALLELHGGPFGETED